MNKKVRCWTILPGMFVGLSLLLLFTHCIKEDVGSFTDKRDGNVYKTVTIGTQVWMSENLRYLPSVVPAVKESITTPYYYVYDYYGTNVNEAKGTSNYATYGVLYNWAAACSSCPEGWHLPSEAEWIQLTDYLGGKEVAGSKLKEAGSTHWRELYNNETTNESGFTALPGGSRFIDSSFCGIEFMGYWWSVTEGMTNTARNISMQTNYKGVNISNGIYKRQGLSVRCIKD